MKNGLLIFAGAFALLAFSFAGVVLFAHHQLSGLTQYKDPVEDSLFPAPFNGLADQGRLVYQDLGCVSCHTQQVRREGFGADIARKWGLRQSVARDYIREKTVFIGSSRFGPDLRNIGARTFAGADVLYNLLYDPGTGAPGMPAYSFLFEIRPAGSVQSSHKAFKVTADGREIVPTHRAEALVAYLLSLKDTYEYPEAKPFVETAKPEGGH
jgi:cytochrome c oxidase cbb3-type subunit 2